MRYTLGVLAGISITLLCVHRGRQTLAWLFTRIEVATDPECAPRYWTTHAGIRTEGPWT